MILTNTHTQTNNSVLLNHPLAPSSHPIKISNATSNLYLGPGSPNVPGMTNVYFAPSNLIDAIKALIASKKIGDKEGVVENTLRIIGTPFCFSNAFMQCIYNAIHAGVYFNVLSHPSLSFALSTTGPLSLAIAIAGFIFCVIEGAIESFGLIRTIDFFKNSYPAEIEELKESIACDNPEARQLKFSSCIKKILQLPLPPDVISEMNSFLENRNLSEPEFLQMAKQISEKIETNVYLSELTKLQRTYLQISPEEVLEINDYVQNELSRLSLEEQNARKTQITQNTLDSKKNELIRKIHPWLVDEIENSLPDLIRDLQSPLLNKQKEAKDIAESVFANIKIQAFKKMLIHSVGMLAVLITIAGLITGCITCPILIPFLLLGLGGCIAITRGILHWGYMNSKGWNFSTQDCIEGLIPESVRELFEKTFSKKNEYKIKIRDPIILKYTLPGSRVITYKQGYKNSLARLDFTLAKV